MPLVIMEQYSGAMAFARYQEDDEQTLRQARAATYSQYRIIENNDVKNKCMLSRSVSFLCALSLLASACAGR